MEKNNDVPDTKAMVAKLEASRSIAAQSLGDLEIHREKMIQIQLLDEEHTQELTKAQWLAKRLSVRGRISTFFNKRPGNKGGKLSGKSQKDKQTKVSKKDLKEVISDEDIIWNDQTPIHPDYSIPELTQEQQQLIKEQDNDLGQMSNILQDMKDMGLKMNTSLNAQSKMIDHIGEQVDKNAEVTQKTAMKLAR